MQFTPASKQMSEQVVKSLSRANVLKALKARGVTSIVPNGRFSIDATLSDGHRGVFDPRDLLRELLNAEIVDNSHLTSLEVDKQALKRHLDAAQECARILALDQYDIDRANNDEALRLARYHVNDAIEQARKIMSTTLL